MKKTILFLTTLLSVVLLRAQTEKPNPPISNEDFFKQAELVFEGYFLRYVDSYDTKGEGKSKDCVTISAYKSNAGI